MTRWTVAICSSMLVVAMLMAIKMLFCVRPQAFSPNAPVCVSPEVSVKAKEVVAERSASRGVVDAAATSAAVAVVCGGDAATADRYEERSAALRSVSRRRDLPSGDVAALTEFLRSTGDPMRDERVAALKNDVMNLLRRQSPPPEGLADTLVGMFCGGRHPAAVLDYCIQHLGAMQNDVGDSGLKSRIRSVFVEAAKQKKRAYSGTALYSLAATALPTPEQEAELRRLTFSLCRPDANVAARVAAIQLAGERGYAEALPVLRETLSSPRRDAVLDIVCLGSVGLLGSSADLPLLERFARLDSRRALAANAAIRRIKERESVK